MWQKAALSEAVWTGDNATVALVLALTLTPNIQTLEMNGLINTIGKSGNLLHYS